MGYQGDVVDIWGSAKDRFVSLADLLDDIS